MDAKGKDCAPELTVERFEQILSDLGIRFRESALHVVDGAYSLVLEDPRHGWHVNGKGTDEKYCRASAFGEAMERLQTRFAYDYADLSPEARTAMGFICAPDEEMRPAESIREAELLWAEFRRLRGSEPEEEDLPFFRELTGMEETPFVPYYSVREGKTVMLPEILITLLAGTNGMAAGNTCAEAMCQALCEIAERYVKYVTLRDGLTPPDLPGETLSAEVAELKRQIEERSGMRLFLRDMSLGRGFPVVGLLAVDEQRQRYRAKYGSHPRFSVAAERCLTELMQGSDPGDPEMKELMTVPWTGGETAWNNSKNLVTAFRMDIAQLPDSFLAGEPSWAFVPWDKGTGENNEEFLAQLIHLFLREAPDIYIRNYGFLGVPAFRIYIPGMSMLPRALTHRLKDMYHLQQLMDEVGRRPLTGEEAMDLLDALEDPDTAIGGWEQRLEQKWSLPAVRGLMHYMRGEDGEAQRLLAEAGTARELCMARWLELEKRGMTPERRDALLERLFGTETARPALAVMKDRGNALGRWQDPAGLLAMLWEQNTPRRAAKKQARREAVDTLHLKIKEKMISGMPEQRPEAWLQNPAALAGNGQTKRTETFHG